MPEIAFEVWCGCGEELCNTVAVTYGYSGFSVAVGDCEKCIAAAREEGDDEGYDRGYDDGVQAGKTEAGEED